MIFYVAGVNHNDLRGRERLRLWLQSIFDTENGPPNFIAIEWDSDVFEKIKNQRKQFRELFQNKWPSLSLDDLNIIESSLGYEGDSHNEIFPKAEIIWLDNDRMVEESKVRNYATDRFTLIRGFVNNYLTHFDLDSLSKIAWEIAKNNERNSEERDKKFANMILKKIQKGDGKWAIIIVGAEHAENREGSMRMLLESKDYICKVAFLKPNY